MVVRNGVEDERGTSEKRNQNDSIASKLLKSLRIENEEIF